MPSRVFNGERFWNSDKVKQVQPSSFRPEYAALFALALSDGTFEAGPEKVFAQCYAYNRDGWTVRRVTKLLDEFERVGLLQRRTDPEGKVWGFWTGCEDTLPSKSEAFKYKAGKKFLFMPGDIISRESSGYLDNIKSESRAPHDCIKDGIGFGLDKVLDRKGLEPAAVLPADTNTHGKFVPNAYGFLRNNPDRIYERFTKVWQESVPGGICKKPFKRGWEWWKDTCAAVPTDTLIPAFELWAAENADKANEGPILDFLKDLSTWTQKVIPATAEAKPKVPHKTLEQRIEADPKLKASIEAQQKSIRESFKIPGQMTAEEEREAGQREAAALFGEDE